MSLTEILSKKQELKYDGSSTCLDVKKQVVSRIFRKRKQSLVWRRSCEEDRYDEEKYG